MLGDRFDRPAHSARPLSGKRERTLARPVSKPSLVTPSMVMPPHLRGHAQVRARHDEPAPVGRFHGMNGPGHNRPLRIQFALYEARYTQPKLRRMD